MRNKEVYGMTWMWDDIDDFTYFYFGIGNHNKCNRNCVVRWRNIRTLVCPILFFEGKIRFIGWVVQP